MTQPAIQIARQVELREARIDDAEQIYSLLEGYAEQGIILPRTKADVLNQLPKFNVVAVDGQVAGCGALEIFTEELCEVRSLVVHRSYEHRGFGRMIVEELIERAREIGLSRIMALTYVPEFFHRLGFRTVPKEIFPEKVWGVCFKCIKFYDCTEIAVLKDLR